MTGYKFLAIAVLLDAAQDMQSTNPDLRYFAKRWLTGGSEGLQIWCSLAGLNPDKVAEQADRPDFVQRMETALENYEYEQRRIHENRMHRLRIEKKPKPDAHQSARDCAVPELLA